MDIACSLLTVLVTDKHFAVQDLVVFEDVVEHLLVDILGRNLEGDLHTTSCFRLEVDVSSLCQLEENK